MQIQLAANAAILSWPWTDNTWNHLAVVAAWVGGVGTIAGLVYTGRGLASAVADRKNAAFIAFNGSKFRGTPAKAAGGKYTKIRLVLLNKSDEHFTDLQIRVRKFRRVPLWCDVIARADQLKPGVPWGVLIRPDELKFDHRKLEATEEAARKAIASELMPRIEWLAIVNGQRVRRVGFKTKRP